MAKFIRFLIRPLIKKDIGIGLIMRNSYQQISTFNINKSET